MDFITAWDYIPSQPAPSDSTDLIERAGYMSIKQMVDLFRDSGRVFSTTRSAYHDFDSEEEIESADPALWSSIAAYRAAGVDNIDLAAINSGYIEYLKSKTIPASAPVSSPSAASITPNEEAS